MIAIYIRNLLLNRQSLDGKRDEFYVQCADPVMENVYADLDLEQNYAYPHVQGWMSVFENWAEHPAFDRTWRLSKGTYAPRFQNFYEHRGHP
jgi:hypothetical protein